MAVAVGRQAAEEAVAAGSPLEAGLSDLFHSSSTLVNKSKQLLYLNLNCTQLFDLGICNKNNFHRLCSSWNNNVVPEKWAQSPNTLSPIVY